MAKKPFILITGGASGIGYEIAKTLARGCRSLIIIDKNSDKLKKIKPKFYKYKTKCIFRDVDLYDTKEINALFDDFKNENIHIQHLINNAGYQENADILKLTLEQWDSVFKVNLDAAFILSQKVAKNMITDKIGGTIINITSIHSHIIRGIAHYSCSKASLDMLTKELAIRLAPHNIRVNSVAPGAIDTPMIRRDLKNKNLIKKASQKIPLGKLGEAKDIANAVDFLISEKAKYITGSTITVDGGLSLII